MMTIIKPLFGAYRAVLTPLFAALGAGCRFHPSCSRFSQEALHRHGLVRGLGLTFGRLLRCHPGCDGGYDPVP